MKTLEFHRPSRGWLQVRCPCGCWTKDPCAMWESRSKRPGFEYMCDEGKLHMVSPSTAARLRELIEHPGWD
jgi:hypothetical protein